MNTLKLSTQFTWQDIVEHVQDLRHRRLTELNVRPIVSELVQVEQSLPLHLVNILVIFSLVNINLYKVFFNCLTFVRPW